MKLNEVTIVESKYPQQLDEFNWDDIKKGAASAVSGAKKIGNKLAAAPGAIQRGSKSIEKAANKYTKGAKKTGDAVAGAANALGRAGAETFKQTVARPVSGLWGAGKQVAQAATGATKAGYGDVKQAVQTVGQGVGTVATDVGQGASKALGGTGKAVGAVASVPQGVGRAMKRGYSAGVNAIGGPDDATLAAQARAAKTPNFGTQAYAPATVSYKGLPTTSSAMTPINTGVDQAIDAVDSLNKKGKQVVHQKLEKELYGDRSDSARRNVARGAKIKAKKSKMPSLAVAESKEFKVWGQK